MASPSVPPVSTAPAIRAQLFCSLSLLRSFVQLHLGRVRQWSSERSETEGAELALLKFVDPNCIYTGSVQISVRQCCLKHNFHSRVWRTLFPSMRRPPGGGSSRSSLARGASARVPCCGCRRLLRAVRGCRRNRGPAAAAVPAPPEQQSCWPRHSPRTRPKRGLPGHHDLGFVCRVQIYLRICSQGSCFYHELFQIEC